MNNDKPVIYDPGVEIHINYWAAECGCALAELRQLSEQAIRTSHDQATLHDQARGRQPAIWELDFGKGRVVYTVEPRAVVIRGYHYDVPGEPLDECDGGGYFCDYEWCLEP